MFFLLPTLVVIVVYILAAVLPAFYLMRRVNRLDTVEKEPPALLLTLTLLGIAAALVSMVFEALGESLLSAFLDADSPAYAITLAFLVVAVVEEGAKFFFLKRRTWRNPSFNYRFDGIVYAAYLSLGFAAFENIGYVMGYGLTTAIPRALLAIPGHLSFSVFMGLFYGRAKQCENDGDPAGKTKNLIAGYASAVFLHGFYDACAMIGTVLSTLVFLIFVALMFFAVVRLLRRESRTDEPA